MALLEVQEKVKKLSDILAKGSSVILEHAITLYAIATTIATKASADDIPFSEEETASPFSLFTEAGAMAEHLADVYSIAVCRIKLLKNELKKR